MTNLFNWSELDILRLYLTFALVLATLALSQPSFAQIADCRQLQSQIAALDQASLRRSNPYAGEIQKQRTDLNRAAAYAHSLGCDKQQFLFFGNAPPPQCNNLNANIRSLQASLAQMQAYDRAPENSRLRQDLMERFNAYCRGGADQRQQGFFEQLFGIAPRQMPAPLPPPADEQPGDFPDEPAAHGGSEAVCVRTCDGGFFPLNYSARKADPEVMADLCHALCPNAETAVYTKSPSKEIQSSVSLDGEPYSDLPNALKYQKTFDPACTCKDPKQSWVEALAGAEQLLGHQRKGDIIVTPEKSLEMSRPADPKARGPKTSGELKWVQPSAGLDDLTSTEAKSGAGVPTATKDSAGIASKDAPANSQVFQRGQGDLEEITGPDGIKRRVRIVGPTP